MDYHLHIDTNNILVATDTINETKMYNHTIDGYTFSAYDKILLVRHKQQIKEVHFKELGDKMNVFYLTNRERKVQTSLDTDAFRLGMSLYHGFDENTGEQYAFLHKFPHQKIEELNDKLTKINVPLCKQTDEKGICIVHDTIEDITHKNINCIHSFLYALTLLYGKMDIKNDMLHNVKIHLHLFGPYIQKKEVFDTIIQKFSDQGIFVQHDVQQTNNGIIYQISSSDYELLQSFTNFHKRIATIDKIRTFDAMLQTKEALLLYIDQHKGFSSADKQHVTKRIQSGVLKVLQK